MASRRDRREREEVERKAQAAREAVSWVQGRLNVLEFLILFFALILALLGGALVAWLIGSLVDVSFRWLWAGASLLLFILPGGFVYFREFRTGSRPVGKNSETESKESDG